MASLFVATALSLTLTPAEAGPKPMTAANRSGLPWSSGVYTSTSDTRALEAWRGLPLDVETVFFGSKTWTHLISSAGALKTKVPTVPGQLIIALGMVPEDHRGKLEECAAGQYDGHIGLLKAGVLNNGGQQAINAGKPFMMRLGWEANAVDSGFPWQAMGDGSSWSACFRRWVDILNPVTDASTTPPTRQKNFVIVWNMANRGTFPYPIDNMYPGNEYVDIIASQYYDRCPPLTAGNEAEWLKRISARDKYDNPAGPLAWLNYAKSKGKPYAMPEWGTGGPRNVCAKPGIDNPYFIQKMYGFFQLYAADIAFESYFNAHGYADDTLGSCKLFAPDKPLPDPSSPDYLAWVQRYNPTAATMYRTLWGQDLSQFTPEVAIMPVDTEVAEGNAGVTTFTFAVTRTGYPYRTVSVDWRVGGGAVDGADFANGVLPSGTVSLAAGETSKTVTLPIQGDLQEEADEAFTVTLGNPSSNAKLATATLDATIKNDDVEPPVLAIAAAMASRTEGDSGSRYFSFTVTRSGGTSSAVSASWQVSGGTVNASDFVAGVLPSGTVSFASGQTSKTINVVARGDTEIELDETFDVALSSPSGNGVITAATASGVIQNDDLPAPTLALSPVGLTKAEGNAGSTAFSFTVTRSGDRRPPVSAAWQITGGSADVADFVGGAFPSGTVSLASGEANKTVVFSVQGDRVVELDETFAVTLTSPNGGASITTGTMTGAIQNDDVAPPVLAIAAVDATKAEGAAGTTPFTFVVTRTGDARQAASARWQVSGGAATDFVGGVLPSGTVSLAAGVTSATVTVPVQGDTVVELDEAFTVTLSGPAGATLGTASASGTIINDDVPPPEVTITTVSATKVEGHSGSTAFTFALTRSGNIAQAFRVDWKVVGAGTSPATAADFVGGKLPTGRVSFAAGETRKTITILVQGEKVREKAEGFAVTLVGAAPTTTLLTATATATILNDDR